MWIDIENSAGVKQGDGPILTAQSWESTDRLSRAGAFRFIMPAADPRAALCLAKRRARCYALINGTVTEVGAGVIDHIEVSVDNRGQANLEISGDNLLRELTYTQVGQLVIDDGAGGPDTSGPADIIALAPAGWALDVVNGYNATVKAIAHTFEGESALAAFCKLVEITGERFRLGSGKALVWMKNDQVDSGIRAVQGGDPVSLESNTGVCIIQSLDEEQDSYDTYVGRMYAYGVGSGSTRITLNGAAIGYAGYVIGNDSKGYYLQHTATWLAYGIERYTSFKDIDEADTLAETAYEWMRRQLSPAKSYRLSVTKLDAALALGSTIRVVYKRVVDGYVALDIDDDLVVMEATRRVDVSGLRTVQLMAATIDCWPQGEAAAVMGGMGEAANYYTHPQPGSSTPADHDHTGVGDGGVLTNDEHDGYSDYIEMAAPGAPAANHGVMFARDDGAGVTELCARFNTGDIIPMARQGVTVQTYSETNVTPDRAYDADATTLDELADVLGTLIADLRAQGVLK